MKKYKIPILTNEIIVNEKGNLFVMRKKLIKDNYKNWKVIEELVLLEEIKND